MNESRVRRVPVRGIEVELEEQGGAAPDEIPFVLVHGYTGSRDDFREQLPRLAALGRTLAIDQRGHGGSTNTGDPDGYHLDELAADLDAVLSAVGAPTCDLLGHSMGGMVALRFALAHPERVRSLVLMDTVARPFRFVPPPLLEGAAAVIRAQGLAGLVSILRQRRGLPRPAAQVRCEQEMGSERYWARIEAKLVQMDPVAYSTMGGAQHDGVLERLGEIRCATLVVVGEEDVFFLGPADELEAGIAGARRVTIPRAAHSPQLENPDAWFAAIADHLARVRA